MVPYRVLMEQVLKEGYTKSSRPGVNTKSIFGGRMEFNLQDGFPMVTGKYTPFTTMCKELFLFLKGATTGKEFEEEKVTIWREWVDSNDNLGPIYGDRWLNWGGKPKAIVPPKQDLSNLSVEYGSVTDPIDKKLLTTWRGMIARCYNQNKDNYSYYGGKGVHVCDRWLDYQVFIEDTKNLPGWEEKVSNWKLYQLDKDIKGNGFVYSPEYCVWASKSENMKARNTSRYTVINEQGKEFTFSSSSEFIKEHGLHQGNFDSMLRGKRPKANGFKLLRVEDTNQGINQIAELINTLKTNPDDRRMIVSAWDPIWIPYSALPPCHMMFQFYTRPLNYQERKKEAKRLGYHKAYPPLGYTWSHELMDKHNVPKLGLSCQMYQRSCDLFLGVPFNIAEYSLLIHLVAHCVNMVPDRFVWVGGDVHLYENHFKEARLYLKRPIHTKPTLIIDMEAPKDIDQLGLEHISLQNYNHGAHIPAPVAV